MKITLWYESHNGHERLAAKLVAAKYPAARLVDVSTWTAMRDRPSETGWPDRAVRAFPCLVYDTEDGQVELNRLEGTWGANEVSGAEASAAGFDSRLEEALEEAAARNDIPGGARPCLISSLRVPADEPVEGQL